MIHIIPVQRKHIPGFRSALDQVAREEKYLTILKAFPIKDIRSFVLSNIKNKVSQFMALDDEKVVGWCDIVPSHQTTEKHVGRLGMGILKEYRGQGLGSKLLLETLRHAKSRGLEIVHLDVYSSNQPAIGLYKNSGFRVEGVRKKARKHKGKYDDIVLMSKQF